MTHEPLQITCHLAGPLFVPQGWIALDALLAAAVARRDNYPPIEIERRLPEIPISRSVCGRYHLASLLLPCGWEAHETQYTNRRPVLEAAHTPLTSPKFRTLNIATGPNKAYRIPRSVGHATGQQLAAYLIGDREAVQSLLSLITHVGKRGAVGLGRVERWEVAPCEAWAGFPCIRDGLPLRPLPENTEGLQEPAPLQYTRLTYPYWEGEHELLACPEVRYA